MTAARWAAVAVTLCACTEAVHEPGEDAAAPAAGGYGYLADAAGGRRGPDAGAGRAGGPGGEGADGQASSGGDAEGGAGDAGGGAGDAGRGGSAADAPTAADAGGTAGEDAEIVAQDGAAAGCAPTSAGLNGATVVAHTLPTSLPCGTGTTATVTVRNAGTTTWSRALGYRLGTKDDSDPLFTGGTRIELPDDACVPPGGEHTFPVPLLAPAGGPALTDWQMVLEGAEWFGEVADQEVQIPCVAAGEDQIDLSAAVIVKGAPGIAAWPVTSTLTEVTVSADELCTWHTMAGEWPTVPFFDDPESPIEGNQWLFAHIGGTWYGGAGEWLREDQQCKVVKAAIIGPDEFYNDSEEPLHSWIPKPGELVGVMVSTPARAWPAMATVDERSNVVLVPWP